MLKILSKTMHLLGHNSYSTKYLLMNFKKTLTFPIAKKNARNIALAAGFCRFERNNFLDNKSSELLSERCVLAVNGLRAEVFKPSFPPCLSPFLFFKRLH